MSRERMTLLMVDDVAANIDILLETLGLDYTVRVATSGIAALDSVKKAPPDLILLDIMMPGMDGFEVCRRLKADPDTRDIPVIFLTALSEDANEARGLALGAVDYITKPFNTAIVKTRVRNHLELKEQRDHLLELVAQRTRELTRANGRLLELDTLKDDFLRMISHEIRTPANGVLGIGELILDLCPASADRTQYGDLFHASSLRLINLIEDATMIVNLEKAPPKNGAAISFPALFEEVRDSLKGLRISMEPQSALDRVFLQGDRLLLKKALETLALLAASFSKGRNAVLVKGAAGEHALRLHIDIDDLPLSDAQAADFFKIESPVRSATRAETLGLAPVVAHKIISTFGGELRLVKKTGRSGYLEALLIREQGSEKEAE